MTLTPELTSELTSRPKSTLSDRLKRCAALPSLIMALAASPVWAETPSTDDAPEALHILRPVLHTEQDSAELCLEADHPLNDNQRGTMVVKLESDAKKVTLPASGIMVTSTSFCLSPLEHRKAYHLTLSGLKGDKGEKLAGPYIFSFTVPDRKASLSFLSDLYNGGAMRWLSNDPAFDPTLRGVNIHSVKIEIYKIPTLPLMMEAWLQHRQATLAPSESAYFARNKGELVWQGSVDLGDNPNKVSEQKLPLHETMPNAVPGLYLVIASKDANASPSSDDKNPAPLAAAWLLRSNLKLLTLQDKNAFTFTTEKFDATAPAADVRITLSDENLKILAEAKSDANGLASINPDKDKLPKAVLAAAQTPQGDVDFIEIPSQVKNNLLAPEYSAALTLDRNFYAPNTTAQITLALHDNEGKAVTPAESRLYILRPDHTLLTSFAVPKDKAFPLTMAVPMPATNGAWFLLWQQNDGRKLAETALRITNNPDAPQISLRTDRPMIGSDGNLTLFIDSKTAMGKAAPLMTGTIHTEWVKPDILFPDYADYLFGTPTPKDPDTIQPVSFLTDANGQAQIHLSFGSQNSKAPRAAKISILTNKASGTTEPQPLIIPARPIDYVIGIKPLADQARFAESSTARFSIIALDGDGKRHDVSGLNYQILEEGRSFEWFQDDGRWNYKPQEQTRRIGSGNINVKKDSDQRIEWPVAAGNYRLVIRDDDTVLAQIAFSAGWSSGNAAALKPTPLEITLAPEKTKTDTGLKITYHIDQGAFVTAVAADDQIRKVIQVHQEAGDNSLTFPPDLKLHANKVVSVFTRSLGENGTPVLRAGRLELPAATTGNTATQKPEKPQPEPVKPAKSENAYTKTTFTVMPGLALAAHQEWVVPASGKAKDKTPNILLVSTEPAPNLLSLLATRLDTPDFLTSAIADSIHVAKDWGNIITASGLMRAGEIDTHRDDLLHRLMARQKQDGGFGAMPDNDADIDSTAAALVALDGDDRPLVKLSADLAAGWLKRHLDNSWIDEKERANRAVGYAALAITGRTDKASLDYFADTSADKNLPPLAAAQIALAFAKNNNADKANFWLAKTGADASTEIPANLLPILAANSFWGTDKITAPLTKKANAALSSTDDVADILHTLWLVQNRAAPLHISVNNIEQKSGSPLIIPVPQKNAALNLRNLDDKNIYLTPAISSTATTPADASLTRHIYDMDGKEIVQSQSLRYNQNYVITVEASRASTSSATTVMHDNTGSILMPISCALNGELGNTDSLPWLKALALTPDAVCDATPEGVTIQLDPADDQAVWRTAYVVKAWQKGSFVLPPVIAQSRNDAKAGNKNGAATPLRYSPIESIRIQ